MWQARIKYIIDSSQKKSQQFATNDYILYYCSVYSMENILNIKNYKSIIKVYSKTSSKRNRSVPTDFSVVNEFPL